MSYAQRMIESHSQSSPLGAERHAQLIDALVACTQACTACADACLADQERDSQMDLIACIRRCLDCADICDATARVLSRLTEWNGELARALLEACATACRLCGDECAKHGQHGMKHCELCAEACRRCEQACNDALSALAA